MKPKNPKKKTFLIVEFETPISESDTKLLLEKGINEKMPHLALQIIGKKNLKKLKPRRAYLDYK